MKATRERANEKVGTVEEDLFLVVTVRRQREKETVLINSKK